VTAPQRNGIAKCDFSNWLRSHPLLDPQVAGLSITDTDWVVHQFRIHTQHGRSKELQNMMFIEEKSFGSDIGKQSPQRDTISLLAQLLKNRTNPKQPSRFKVQSVMTGKLISLRFFGWHLLQFSHAGPLDSEWIKWDWKPITLEMLVKLLRFELSPITLAPRDERNHHGGAKQRTMDFK
jgi:hypothetical protein